MLSMDTRCHATMQLEDTLQLEDIISLTKTLWFLVFIMDI